MSKIAAALFPLTFLSVTHSISALVVTTGLLGLPEIAAEIVIVQGAVIAAFHAISGNARNLILREHGLEAARRIASARVLLLPALFLAAFMLGVFNAAAGVLLAALLVVRRATEWLAEVTSACSRFAGRGGPRPSFSVPRSGSFLLQPRRSSWTFVCGRGCLVPRPFRRCSRAPGFWCGPCRQ
jgi:hypothetical protein